MARRLVDLSLDNLDDLPQACRSCVYWELDPALASESSDGEIDKEAWISDTLLEWGLCGHLAYVNGTACGYILYAPAEYVPRAASFPTAPVSSDAVLLMSMRVTPGFTGQGIGRALVETVSRDVAQRGIEAVEAFGYTTLTRPSQRACVAPASYLHAIGFATVRDHPQTPRLRLNNKAPSAWRAELEGAAGRVLSGTPVQALTGTAIPAPA